MRTSWYDYGKRLMVRELSENSRVSINALSKAGGCSIQTAMSDLTAIENDLGICYTLEFNDDALGRGLREMVTTKFKEKPQIEETQKVFKGPVSVLAMMEGGFDLFAILSIDE